MTLDSASSHARQPIVASVLLGTRPSRDARSCRRKFLRHFSGGFHDETYLAWERQYKEAACERWRGLLGVQELRRLVRSGKHSEVANRAIAVESRTNLLFSFEKMALRDALKSAEGARTFATGLLHLVESDVGPRSFERWCAAVAELPRVQTRVLTWPVVTVFGFLARPRAHIFFKPMVTRRAAAAYGLDFHYETHPGWDVYAGLLDFAKRIRRDVRDLRPRDMIDMQSFIWVLGSAEYP